MEANEKKELSELDDLERLLLSEECEDEGEELPWENDDIYVLVEEEIQPAQAEKKAEEDPQFRLESLDEEKKIDGFEDLSLSLDYTPIATQKWISIKTNASKKQRTTMSIKKKKVVVVNNEVKEADSLKKKMAEVNEPQKNIIKTKKANKVEKDVKRKEEQLNENAPKVKAKEFSKTKEKVKEKVKEKPKQKPQIPGKVKRPEHLKISNQTNKKIQKTTDKKMIMNCNKKTVLNQRKVFDMGAITKNSMSLDVRGRNRHNNGLNMETKVDNCRRKGMFGDEKFSI